jgi:hypothetical protein
MAFVSLSHPRPSSSLVLSWYSGIMSRVRRPPKCFDATLTTCDLIDASDHDQDYGNIALTFLDSLFAFCPGYPGIKDVALLSSQSGVLVTRCSS